MLVSATPESWFLDARISTIQFEVTIEAEKDSDEWPAHAPVGMWIDYGLVNEFLREWCLRKEQLKSGEISEDEYFEWKINWPASSSSVDEKENDKKNNSYKWRNNNYD